MKRILVTGGTGFFGKHVQKAFEHSSDQLWTPTRRELNCLDKQELSDKLRQYQPDVILHMAVLAGGILANKNSPADFIRINTQMSLNIYEAARERNITKVYSLGSICCYPKYCQVPFKEDDIWNGIPEETNMPYGQAKRTLMVLSQTYREQYGIKGAHFIPVNMIGEHDHFDLTNSHVVPALIRKFDNAVINNLPVVECFGTGIATREFLYAGDCAQAIVKAVLTNFDSPLPINLGVGKDISIKDLAVLIANLVGFKGEVAFNGSVSDGQPKRLLDVSRAKELLDWTAQTPLEEGLKKTITWYQANRDLV